MKILASILLWMLASFLGMILASELFFSNLKQMAPEKLKCYEKRFLIYQVNPTIPGCEVKNND
jgi:hypothetical protein